MARFNEILVPRYNRALQKLMGMKGEVPSPQLGSEIMPVLPIPSLREDRYLFGWSLFGFQLLQANFAAQNSAIRFRNPTGSNMIAVIEKLNITTDLADTVLITAQLANTDLAVVAPATTFWSIDQRGVSAPTLVVSRANNNAGGINAVGFVAVAANLDRDIIVTDDQEIPILPGSIVQITSNGLNENLRVGGFWRERYLEESERT